MGFDYRRRQRDFAMIFATRALRMFSYGMLSIVFFDNLLAKGLSSDEASWIQSAIVFGDIFVSLVLTTQADRIGRINTLMLGSLLKLISGLFYAQSSNPVLLVIVGILGVISVSGGEIGPFMPIQQSALTQLVEDCSDDLQHEAETISAVFGYYNMAGYVSQATGSAFAGFFIAASVDSLSTSKDTAITNIVRMYGLIGVLMFIGYFFMDRNDIQAREIKEKKIVNCSGIRSENIGTIVTLSCLFAVDAFAGAFVAKSFLSYYYQQKYGFNFDKIGVILFVCTIISGISGILSSNLVDRFGTMATMIYTHLPSNIFLFFIAFAPTPTISIILLFARFSISQMDVPARQTYVSMVVSSQQRSAANGITNIARSVGVCIGLGINGHFMKLDKDSLEFSYPFIISGSLTIMYDIAIGCCFLWRQRDQPETSPQQSNIHPEIGYSQLKEEVY